MTIDPALPHLQPRARRNTTLALHVFAAALALSSAACDAILLPANGVDHPDVVNEEEHIAIPDDLAEAAKLLPTDTPHLPGYHRAQVLVSIDAANSPSNTSEMALFTVSDVFDRGNNPDVEAFIWDHIDAKERLEYGANPLNGRDVFLDSAVAQDWDDPCPAQDPAYGLVECLDGDPETVFGQTVNYVFLAPHGGNIEPGTDEQASDAHTHSFGNYDMSQRSFAWYLKGFRQGGNAYKHWHITSTDIGRASFPKLDLIGPKIENIFNGFDWAVAFHGMVLGNRAKYTIYVGGGAPVCIRDEVVTALQAVLANEQDVQVIRADNTVFPGDDPDNLVNWLTEGGVGGIQLEQTPAVRDDYGTEVAETMAELLPTLACP